MKYNHECLTKAQNGLGWGREDFSISRNKARHLGFREMIKNLSYYGKELR